MHKRLGHTSSTLARFRFTTTVANRFTGDQSTSLIEGIEGMAHRRYGIKSRHTTILVLYDVNYFPVAFMDTRAECVKKRRRNKIGTYEFSSEASKTRLTPIIQNK